MPERIVTAYDGSENARRAVAAASELAKDYRAELHLIHVTGSGRIPAALAHMAEVEHMTERRGTPNPQNVANVFGNLATAEKSAASPEVAHAVHRVVGERLLKDASITARENGAPSVEGMLREGSPAEAILEAAEQVNADLIVLGTRGLSDLKGLLLGSVSHKVIQLSSCSCLVVK